MGGGGFWDPQIVLRNIWKAPYYNDRSHDTACVLETLTIRVEKDVHRVPQSLAFDHVGLVPGYNDPNQNMINIKKVELKYTYNVDGGAWIHLVYVDGRAWIHIA